jgi:hypothetical protein
VLQRSDSKWRVGVAFTAAASIHLSALAIPSLHREPSMTGPGATFTDVDVIQGYCSNRAGGDECFDAAPTTGREVAGIY